MHDPGLANREDTIEDNAPNTTWCFQPFDIITIMREHSDEL
jgi:hypothetical protein